MKLRLLSLLAALIVSPSAAFATCAQTPSGDVQRRDIRLNLQELNTILAGGRYACGRSTAVDPPGWNELHSGGTNGASTEQSGTLIEQHEGGSTVETVGTWATSTFGNGQSERGRVTYAYKGGKTYVYEVSRDDTTLCTGSPTDANCTVANAVYEFCQVFPGTVTFRIYVSNTFQAPTFNSGLKQWVMNTNCPANP